MTTFFVKRLLPAVLLLFLLLLLTLKSQAQTRHTTTDSIARVYRIDILKHQLLIAGNLYKIKKFRLPAPLTTNPDSLFRLCMQEYRDICNNINAAEQANYFSDDFYNESIPVAQYFRSPADAALLISDRERLHPGPLIADPKHHDEQDAHEHHFPGNGHQSSKQ
ncbi:hypothetical protein [Taibaiella chishuiensis]|uniref:Uncharacterized protein n=1 Tax=Taibaiella chishuiensis TaxID=1434707 RepID=A0A2P8DDK1_9BACT|nr:hypothetical protein [Taibaiella chishuiensis]PSK95282.1 hypothetical protein B0I18_1011448 [Taibaiella chishuiensis]